MSVQKGRATEPRVDLRLGGPWVTAFAKQKHARGGGKKPETLEAPDQVNGWVRRADEGGPRLELPRIGRGGAVRPACELY